MDIGAFGKGKGKQSKGKHGKGKGKGKQGQQGQQGQHGQDWDKSKDNNKDSVECWNCGKRGHFSKDCWFKKNTKGGSKGKHKPKKADAHKLDSKPTIAEPEVEIDEFSMTYLTVDALQEFEKVRGSEWIKIGVDTGAGKTAWPQSITYGTTILGVSDLTFRTATGELLRGGNLVQIVGCDDWGSNLRVRGVVMIGDPISEFEVFKRRCAKHCCLRENTRQRVESLCCMVTKVTCSTKIRM